MWYPIKNRQACDEFRTELYKTKIPAILDISLEIRRPKGQKETFDGTGMAIANPPYALEKELKILMPWLKTILEENKGSGLYKLNTLPIVIGRFRFFEMVQNVILYELVGDISGRSREIPSCPKPSSPVALFKFRKFLLYFAGRTALHSAHEVTDRVLGRYLNKQVDMVT